MSELATMVDVEHSRQAARDLIDIMQGVLAEKIEKVGSDVDAKFQSLENSFCSLQGRLDDLMLTFIAAQEARHTEIREICNTLNNHEDRIKKLGSNGRDHSLGIY